MSIDKAVAILGYHPRYSSLEAVYESLAWLVEHGQVDAAGHQLAEAPTRPGAYQA